jgi:hypothetical protein
MEQPKENTVGQPNLSQAPGQQPAKLAPADDQAKQPVQEVLSATITYLEGLPTGVNLESAVENIQSWQQKIREANQPEMNEIADHMGGLIKYLTTSEPDGKAIGRSMVQLGELVMVAANQVEAGAGSQLKKLGNWLKEAGEAM